MSDNFWKDRYKETWEKAAVRETEIQQYIQQTTGFELEKAGMGTGSTEYLSGSAASHGHAKGSADFRIRGTNIEVEVIGDLTGKVDSSQDLWIRPDKIEDAIKNHASEKWVIHHLMKDKTVRAISLDTRFFTRYSKNQFKIVQPTIRGTRETYVSIPANDESVHPISFFIEHLKAKKKGDSKAKL